MANFVQTTQQTPVQLIVGVRNLHSPYMARNPHPYVILYRQTSYAHNPFEEIGRTVSDSIRVVFSYYMNV